jgi:hypothetical protein
MQAPISEVRLSLDPQGADQQTFYPEIERLLRRVDDETMIAEPLENSRTSICFYTWDSESGVVVLTDDIIVPCNYETVKSLVVSCCSSDEIDVVVAGNVLNGNECVVAYSNHYAAEVLIAGRTAALAAYAA